MDKAAEENRINDELAKITAWEAHPITQELVQYNQDTERRLVGIMCTHEINSLETFFSHFAMIGEIKALRRLPSMIAGMREDKQKELEEL